MTILDKDIVEQIPPIVLEAMRGSKEPGHGLLLYLYGWLATAFLFCGLLARGAEESTVIIAVLILVALSVLLWRWLKRSVEQNPHRSRVARGILLEAGYRADEWERLLPICQEIAADLEKGRYITPYLVVGQEWILIGNYLNQNKKGSCEPGFIR